MSASHSKAGIRLGEQGQYLLGDHRRAYADGVEVFRARQVLLERDVEVHILRSKRDANPSVHARFLERVQCFSEFSHPGLIPITDIDSEGPRAYFTTPDRGALSLDVYCKAAGGVLDPEAILELAVSLGGALATFHQSGVVFRHISEHSVFVDLSRGAYFGEFPLGRDKEVVDARDPPLLYQRLAGQPWDERVDVWLLCALLYRCLTGVSPYPPEAANLPRMLLLDRARAGVKVVLGFDQILDRGLVIDSGSRYASAIELMEDLVELKGRAVVLPGTGGPTLASARKHRTGKRRKVPLEPRAGDGAWAAARNLGKPAASSRLSIEAGPGRRPPPRRDGGSLRAAGGVLALLVALSGGHAMWKASQEISQAPSSDLSVPVALHPAGVDHSAVRRRALAALETEAIRALHRETGVESFEGRWRVLVEWAGFAPPELGLTSTSLHRLRLRHLRGDDAARGELDEWLGRAREVLASGDGEPEES